jgi:hypothetical protein
VAIGFCIQVNRTYPMLRTLSSSGT